MSRKYQITAILYDKKGNVLSIGKNSYVKTHPIQAQYANQVGEPNKVFLHAEIDAIIKCKNLKKAHKIVIIRYMSDGQPGNAKPCSVCQEALRKSGIKIIEHT